MSWTKNSIIERSQTFSETTFPMIDSRKKIYIVKKLISFFRYRNIFSEKSLSLEANVTRF